MPVTLEKDIKTCRNIQTKAMKITLKYAAKEVGAVNYFIRTRHQGWTLPSAWDTGLHQRLLIRWSKTEGSTRIRKKTNSKYTTIQQHSVITQHFWLQQWQTKEQAHTLWAISQGPLKSWHKLPVCRTPPGSERNWQLRRGRHDKNTATCRTTKCPVTARLWETNISPSTAQSSPYPPYPWL